MSLRRCLLSRVLAVCFVALIVLPFTAPFQVWSAGAPISKAQGDDFKTSDKASKDVAVAAFTPSGSPCSLGVAFRRRKPADLMDRPRALPTVLRL